MLPDTHHLLFFLTATLLLNLTPGSDVLYVASHSLQSYKHGLLAAIGISIGVVGYVLATAFGLTEVLRESPKLYELIKISGAIYLIFLAWQVSRSPLGDLNVSNQNSSSSFRTLYRGMINTLLNPKVGIFFVTFLPQFVETTRGKVWLQLISLGFCFIISGTLVNLFYAFTFSKLRESFFSSNFVKKWMHKMTALIFCLIGVKVLIS